MNDLVDSRTRNSGSGRIVSDRLLLVLAALLATALKLYCAATTYGSPDVTIFCRFGALINEIGLGGLYRFDTNFNHTPFTGHFVAALLALASHISPAAPHIVPRSFPFLLRLPSIVADLVALVFVTKICAATGKSTRWPLVLCALSPVAFMVSGYHGNVDSVMVCLVVAAAYFAVKENALASAVFLGAACAIKIVPLLLLPAFTFFWYARGRRVAVRFVITFAIGCLIAWSEALVAEPGCFVRNVFGYNSYRGGWGITYVAALLARHFGVQSETWYLETVLASITELKFATLAFVTVLAWLRRNGSPAAFLMTIAYSWVAFAILAPGFIPYYLVWLGPFVLMISASWYSAVTAASSVYLFAYYQIMNQHMPWNISDPRVSPTWCTWGIIPYVVLVSLAVTALLARRIAAASRRPTCAITFPSS